MSIDGFLTFISLIIAAFAILPRSKRLELKLYIGRGDYLIYGIWFSLVLYLQLYSSFKKHGLDSRYVSKVENFFNLNFSELTYLFSIFLLFYICFTYLFRRISYWNIKRFQNFVSQLISDQKWSELFEVIEDRAHQLYKIYSGKFLGHRIAMIFTKRRVNILSHLSETQITRILDLHSEGNIEKITIPKRTFLKYVSDHLLSVWNWIVDKISFLIPKTNKYLDTSKEIVEEVLLSSIVVENLARIRPYVALSLLKFPFAENKDFVELFLKSLHSNPKSVLYREINYNLSSSSSPYERYDFPPKNKLLIFLLQNGVNAEEYNVWKPIGDSVIEYLDRLYLDNNPDYDIPLNLFDKYRSEDCPAANGILFFDIMIREAFFSDVEWHMFLFYFDYFTDRITRNIKASSDSQNTAYHRLLSMMVERLTDWIELLEHSKPNQKNTQLEKVSGLHENGNIPKSAIICLGSVVKKIATSSKVSRDFKNDMFQYCFHSYFKLISINKDYAEVLAIILKKGGAYLNHGIADLYYTELQYALNEIDNITYGFENVNELKRLILDEQVQTEQ